MRRLGEIIRVLKGHRAARVFDYPVEGAKRYLQIEDLRPDSPRKYTIDDDGTAANRDDVLIAWDGANAGTVGFGLEGYVGSTLAILRAQNTGIHAPYLGYFLRSRFDELQAHTTGATVPHLSRHFLEQLKIPLPSLIEQRRIADSLTRADRLRRHGEQIWSGFLRSIFLLYSEGAHANKRGWRLSTLGEACEEIYRYPTFYGFDYVPTGVPVVRIGDILADGEVNPRLQAYKFIPPETSNMFPRTKLEVGDIVMAVRGDGSTGKRIGMVRARSLAGANISANLLRFKVNTGLVQPTYLYHFMTSARGQQIIERQITRTAKKTITSSAIKAIRISLPPLSIQTRFAEVAARIERLRRLGNETARQAEELFQALLQRSFGEARTII
jgi:type I restriction enzyme S subunit